MFSSEESIWKQSFTGCALELNVSSLISPLHRDYVFYWLALQYSVFSFLAMCE